MMLKTQWRKIILTPKLHMIKCWGAGERTPEVKRKPTKKIIAFCSHHLNSSDVHIFPSGGECECHVSVVWEVLKIRS